MTKTSTAIILNDKEMQMLESAQQAGLQRGVTLLSNLTFSKTQMAISGLQAGVSIASASSSFASGGSDDTVGSIAGDAAEAKIQQLLHKCWDKAREKVENNIWLSRACDLLEVGINQLLSWVKGLIFSGGVLDKLVPLYGNIKGIVDGAIQAVDARSQHTVVDALGNMGPQVSSGVATAALEGFTKYAQGEMLRAAGKSAWTFAKSIGGLLAEIFSFGAWTVISFATAVVEAIVGFAYGLVQAILFDRTTEKFGQYAEARSLPSAEDFRTIITGCPYVGCVFFAAANYIGHFNLTSVLASPNRVLSTKMLTESIPKINDAQLAACGYTRDSSFTLDFRSAEAQQEYTWILKMIEGYSTDTPKAEFLTQDATRWSRFKHKAKSAYYRFK